jgi:hypothetical protein
VTFALQATTLEFNIKTNTQPSSGDKQQWGNRHTAALLNALPAKAAPSWQGVRGSQLQSGETERLQKVLQGEKESVHQEQFLHPMRL